MNYKCKRALQIDERIATDTHDKMNFMLKNIRGEEYQLDGIPISTHVGRSSSRSFLNDPVVISWRERIKEWMD